MYYHGLWITYNILVSTSPIVQPVLWGAGADGGEEEGEEEGGDREGEGGGEKGVYRRILHPVFYTTPKIRTWGQVRKPEVIRPPSGENATEWTHASVAMVRLWEVASQMQIVLSFEPETSFGLSGENATEVT
jgi:hypothetical protein